MKPIVFILFFSIHFISSLYSGAKNDLTSVMVPDGTLNLHSGFSGSLDLTGDHVNLDPDPGHLFTSPLLTPQWNALGPGLNGVVQTIEVYGNDVYAAGNFTDAGGDPDADHVARWDGCMWHAVCPGLTDGNIMTLAINGDDVYIGGWFTNVDGNPDAYYIAHWDGTNWNALGSGLNTVARAIVIDGNDVYVGGWFTNAGGNASADYIARWDGTNWNAFSSGLSGTTWGVNAIAINGNDLYVGGDFLDAGGNQDADWIARWDGNNWNALGPGLSGPYGGVYSVVINNNDIYAGGIFLDAGGNPDADFIARWDGTLWNNVGPSTYLDGVADLTIVNANDIYVCDAYWNLVHWDGNNWTLELTGFPIGYAYTVTHQGNDVYTGGLLFMDPEVPNAEHIARWGEPDIVNEINLSGIPEEVCDDDPSISLPTTQSGYTGDWSGDGVNNNIFNPTGLIGDITLTFTPEPGQCVSPVDTLITVINCSPPPCPSAGVDTMITVCPTGCECCIIWLQQVIQADSGGTWEPPNGGNGGYWGYPYYPCAEGEGSFTYTQNHPGCPIDQATVTITFPWQPCNWEIADLECTSGNTGTFTIPPINGSHTGTQYILSGCGITFSPDTGYLDSTMYVTFTIDEWCDFYDNDGDPLIGCIQIHATLIGDISCSWEFTTSCYSEYLLFCDLNCDCADPVFAGEDSFIDICADTASFDLTQIIGGDPDPGGTWTPALASGGNIYDPVIDGSGTFTYTVSSSGCADDQATVTVNVQPISPAIISGVPSTVCETAAPIVLSTVQNGIIGNWSGTGVANNQFNPSGLNGIINITFTPDPNQCTSPASTTIEVLPFVIISITGIPDSVCQLAQPVSLPTTQTGINGNWSGNGVTNNVFNPNGLSGNIVLVFTPNANECADPASAMINVSPAITPTISGVPDSLCQTDPSVNLPIVQNGVSGIWSGNGVMNNVFNPTGLNGSISITFTPDANQCANTATTSIQVSPVIIPLISGIPASVCVSSPPLSLANVQNGIAGEWSGQNVTNNVFDPAGLMGNIILTFTPEAGQCATIATTSISVAALLTPIIMGVPALLCETEAPVPLPGIQNGINGNWSGAGVSNNNFDPSGLTGIITLTFVPDTGQCATSALTNITIEQSLIPNISGIPSTVCEADAAIPLPNVQEGISGDWSGPGVTNNIFNPSGFSGSVSLLFTPNAGMCASANSIDIMVEMAITPFISGIPDQLCQSANSIALSISQDGILGNWSGTGVSNNIFDPSGLNGNSILSFTPVAGQCANGAMTSIDVVAPVTPGITGVPGSLCETSDSIFLSAVQSGITGNWSGQGVFNNLFDPAGLNGSIQLTFTPDTGQCAITATLPISVNVAPSFQNLLAVCDSTAQSYTVSFDITGGVPGSYQVNGMQLAGMNFMSSPIYNDSTSFLFSLDDQNGCGPVLISGVKNCACATYSGTMNFNSAPIKICAGSQFNVLHNGDQNLDVDDLLAFVLHDNAGTQLGTIYAISGTTSFTVPVGIILGQTYFISSIAGSNDGLGNVDLTDGCLSVSQGIPVVFYQPDAIISPGGNICQSDCFTYEVQLSGEKPFTLEYQLIANGMPFVKMINSDTHAVDIIICPSDYGVTAGNLNIVLTNLTDLNCTVPLSPTTGTEIHVHPEVTADFSTILCDGESIIIHNTLYDQSNPVGMETFPGGSVFGCDSIVNVSLTFYPEVVFDLQKTLCFGESLMVNGSVYDESNPTGTEVFPNSTFHGCDSTVNIYLEFDSVVIMNLSLTLCSGEAILINGTIYDESHPSGSELFIGGSVFGCDSLVNIDLTYFLASYSDIRDTLCTGESLTVNGTVYDALHPNGSEVLKNGSTTGCDSTVLISLAFYPEAVTMIDDTLDGGNNLVINGTTYDKLNPTGIELIPFGSIQGCDSTIVVNLHFRSVALTANLEVVSPLCYGESTGSIIIENIAGGFAVYRVKLDYNSIVDLDAFPFQFTGLSAGFHSIWIQDLNGIADSILIEVEITAPELITVNAGPDQNIKYGEDAMLMAEASFSTVTWTWWPFDFLSCVDCPDPIVVRPDHDILYTLEATDSNGCLASDMVSIVVDKGRDIFVPNIFTPNGDGINDILTLNSNSKIQSIKSLRIFDRWGEVISELKNFPPNDPMYGWDGKFNGKEMNPGVYVWMAEVEYADGQVKIFFDEVSLIR